MSEVPMAKGPFKYRWFDALNKDSLVLDVGSFQGDFTRDIIAKYACRIWSYDPIFDLSTGHAKHVHHKKAVWFTPTVRCNDTMDVGNSVLRPDESTVEVPAVPLDDILREADSVDLLKINVEGAEIPLLFYSYELHRARQILVENHLRVAERFDPPIIEEDITRQRERMARLGFEAQLLDPKYPLYLYFQGFP